MSLAIGPRKYSNAYHRYVKRAMLRRAAVNYRIVS
eukprot:COSAG06_NODE_10800_length_1614_cov_1.326733_2_plen_34_part_01